MIEITVGTYEEQIIRILQEKYPITIEDLEKSLHLSRKTIDKTLYKLQIMGVIQLDPLPDKTYIRLLRNDFKFVQKKRQYKFIKHHRGKRIGITENEEDDNYMYY
ncbi:MAG TPA: HTH domain-containing protein [Thermoplasmatales archaeon]|nr:HTH domain-containing protein [Thermoplasmatales archaeon]